MKNELAEGWSAAGVAKSEPQRYTGDLQVDAKTKGSTTGGHQKATSAFSALNPARPLSRPSGRHLWALPRVLAAERQGRVNAEQQAAILATEKTSLEGRLLDVRADAARAVEQLKQSTGSRHSRQQAMKLESFTELSSRL